MPPEFEKGAVNEHPLNALEYVVTSTPGGFFEPAMILLSSCWVSPPPLFEKYVLQVGFHHAPILFDHV